MEELLEEFTNYLLVVRDYSPRTIPTYRAALSTYFTYAHITKTEQITPTSVEDYQAWRLGQGISRSSNFNFMVALRSFLMFLIRRKGATYQLELFEVPRRKRVFTEYASPEDINNMVDACTRERDRLIILLGFTSGARRREIAQISAENFVGNKFTVIVKGNKQHTYYFSENVASRLRIYMQMERIHSGPLFRTSTGKPLTPSSIAMIIKSAAKKAGLDKRITTHTLRHGFGTAMNEGGVDIRVLQEVMGHENIQTTQRYVHISDHRKQQAVATHGPQVIDTHPIAIDNLESIYKKYV